MIGNVKMDMNDDQLDAITEIINIGVGRAAAALSDMLKKRIGLQVPSVKIRDINELTAQLSNNEIGVDLSILQDFDGGLRGSAILAFPRSTGFELGRILGEPLPQDGELSMELVGLLEEVGNIVLNCVMGTISNMIDSTLDYSVPRLAHGVEISRILDHHATRESAGSSRHMIVLANTRFGVDDGGIMGSLILLLDVDSLSVLIEKLESTASY